MLTTKAIIRFTTHTSHICVDHRGVINVFKTGSRQCDFDVFASDEQDLASDFIITPPPTQYFYISFPGEPAPI